MLSLLSICILINYLLIRLWYNINQKAQYTTVNSYSWRILDMWSFMTFEHLIFQHKDKDLCFTIG